MTEQPKDRIFCEYEDCDQYPEAGATLCAVHLLQDAYNTIEYQRAEVARAHRLLSEQRARNEALAAALESAGDTIDRLTWLRDQASAEILRHATGQAA